MRCSVNVDFCYNHLAAITSLFTFQTIPDQTWKNIQVLVGNHKMYLTKLHQIV
jgi:hypothetical protein